MELLTGTEASGVMEVALVGVATLVELDVRLEETKREIWLRFIEVMRDWKETRKEVTPFLLMVD